MNDDEPRRNHDELEARLRRSLTTVADATRATNRWSEVTARIADPGAARELDYVTVVAPRRRRASRPLAALVAFMAVVAGAFGVASLGGGDGSGTPEKAVEKVFGAIADEDPIGVLQAVAPSERKVLVPMLEQLSSKLEQLHVASDALDLDHLGGVRFDVSDLRLATTQLSDDYALVQVTDAQIGGDVHLSDLPFAQALQGAVLPDAHDPGPFSGHVSGLKLVTVKEDGGWYLGLQASLARLADESSASPGPDFRGGFPERGADSAEDAARQMIEALYARDVRREIELTPVSESAALHVWGPSLEAAMRRSDHGPSNVRLQSLTLGVSDGDDGAKVVRPTSYRVTSDLDGDERTVEFDGRCVTETFPRATDSVDAGRHHVCGPFTGEPVMTTLATFYAALGWGGPPSLAVVEEDGKWFVSVGRTLAVNILDDVDHMSTDEAIRVIRSAYFGATWADIPQEFWDACGVARPAVDAPRSAGFDALNRCEDQLPSSYDGPVQSPSRLVLFGFSGWSSSETEIVDAGATATTVLPPGSTTVIAPPPSTTIVTPTTSGP